MKGGIDVNLISHEALASYMGFREMSVRELAMRTGMSRASIGHLRSGHRKYCSPENARKIAAALNAPVEALFVAKPYRVARNAA